MTIDESKKSYPVAIKFFRSMFLMRCPQCSLGDIYPNLFSIKPKDVCDRCDVRYERDSGVFIMPVFLCYFLGAAFAGLFGLFLGMRYGMFQGFTPTLIAATVVFILLVYRPVKGFWIWMLWLFGLVRTDKGKL